MVCVLLGFDVTVSITTPLPMLVLLVTENGNTVTPRTATPLE